MKVFFCKLIKLISFGKIILDSCKPKIKKIKPKKETEPKTVEQISSVDIPPTKKVLKYTK